MTHTLIPTTSGPAIVDASTPAPGLIAFEALPRMHPQCSFRWLLAHHGGHVLAAFETEEAATAAAVRIAELTDWTRSVMTVAQLISLGFAGGADAFLALLADLGGHDPHA